jgi:hypothetical protein
VLNNLFKTTEQLEAEGWKLVSITGGGHLKRMLTIYEEVGIEVYLKKHQLTNTFFA